MALSSSVLIEEVVAAPGKRRRAMLLRGSGQPYAGAGWGSLLAITTTWYPGNGDEADQQVLGPQEPPSAWTGGWHRTLLSSTPILLQEDDGHQPRTTAPMDLVNFFEAIQRSGRKLRVTWSSEQAPSSRESGIGKTLGSAADVQIVREGRCKSFLYRFSTLHDVEWSMEWEWLGRGKSTQRVTDTRSGVIAQFGAAYESKLQAIVNAAAAASLAKLTPHALTLGQIGALANLPSTIANRVGRSFAQLQSSLGQITGIAKSISSQPGAISNMAISHARNSRAQALSIYRSFSSQGVETLSKKGDVRSQLRAHQTFGAIQDSSLLGARAAQEFEVQVRVTVAQAQEWLGGERAKSQAPSPGSILAVVTAKDSETPQSISQRWYGTPDHAVDILKANGLSWYLAVFAKGQRIVIPVLAGAA